VIFCRPSQLICPLDAAEVECLAFERRMAESIGAALDAGETDDVKAVLDMMAWMDERRAVAGTSAPTN
jgi:hypothetical protein